MIGLMCLKELVLMKQMHRKNVIFAIIGIFLDKGSKFEPYLYNGCHDLMQKAMKYNDVAIVSAKEKDFRIHFWYMSKDDAINIMKNPDFNEKRGLLLIFFLNIRNK